MSSKRSKAWQRRKDALNQESVDACPFQVGDWVTDDIDRETCIVTAVTVERGYVTVHYRAVETDEDRSAQPCSLMPTDPLP